MRKEHVYILFLLIIVVLGIVFFGLYIIAQRNLKSARDQIQAEVAEIEERYQQYVDSKTNLTEETVPDASLSDDSETEANMDTITALEQMDEEIRALESEEWEFEGMDAIFFAEKDWGFLSDSQKQMVKDFYRDNHELILEIRQLAATGGPFGKLDFSQGSKIEVPHYAKIRACLRLLKSNAFMATLSNDYEEAAKDYIAILQFTESVSKEPVLISQMSKNGFFDQAFYDIMEYMPEENLSPDTVLKIIKQSSHLIRRNIYAEAKKRDALGSYEIFEDIKSGDYDYEKFAAIANLNNLDSFLFRFQGSIIMRPFLMLDEQAYTETMERVSEISQYPFYEAKPMLDQISNELENLPPTSLHSRSFLSFSITYFPERQAMFEARVGLLQVGLAVELHHGQYGVYPHSLEEVAPILGGEIPLDPYTGEDFVYKPGEDSFTLYSARSTIIDDPSGRQFVCYSDQEGNLVWRGSRDWRENESMEQKQL